MRLILTGGSGFIGTNLITNCLARPDITLLNLDISPPLNPEHTNYWQRADIMNGEELKTHVERFKPTAVIHLAARTDCDENTSIEDYAVNIQGTQNLLDALAITESIDTLVVVSTQFVLGPGVQPDFDWH